MKYRVKEIETGEESIYIPQYTRFGLIWSNWYRHYGDGFSKKAHYKTMGEAIDFIRKKCTKTNIIYYPIRCEDLNND